MSTSQQAYKKLMEAKRNAEAHGFLVIIWTPEELGETDSGDMEDIVINRGNDFIESSKQEAANANS